MPFKNAGRTSFAPIVAGRAYCRAWCNIMLLVTVSLAMFVKSASAATDEADLSVGLKTLPLLNEKITGVAKFAIIFDPTKPSSKAEAIQIEAILDKGFVAPADLKLTAVMVPITELNKIAGSKLAILTSGLDASYGPFSSMAAANHVLTMSTDLGCVRANKCVLGIVSKPHVEIYFSKAAADAAKIGFGQAFTMLVKQI